MVTIQRDTISGQSKGCALCVQVRYTRLLWHPRWADKREQAFLRVFIAAPVHNPETGYHCRKWAVSVGDAKRRAKVA